MYTVSSFFQSRIGEGVAATNFNMGSALHKNLYALVSVVISAVLCDNIFVFISPNNAYLYKQPLQSKSATLLRRLRALKL